MSKLILLCVLMAAVLVAADDQPDNLIVSEKQIKYYFAGAKGFLDGFEKGLHNDQNKGVSDDCMDENTALAFLKIEKIITGGDLTKLFGSLSKLYELLTNIE